MNYIVLDMEWNQAWPGSPSARRYPQIRGEIIQIGAVRLLEDQTVADEFQILVQLSHYHHLNKRVAKLTGIREAQLKEQGVPFPQAVERFLDWCGEDCVYLTWGFDDLTILRENLALHHLEDGWTRRWYNAQMIFNAQTDGSTSQKALKTAMATFEIEPCRPAHDALGDAYHTALICAMMDLPRGVQEYEAALRDHENGFHGADLPDCISRQVYYGYASREEALEAMGHNQCPTCGSEMVCRRWFSQTGRRYMTMAACEAHGDFLVRVRLSAEEDGSLKASRLVYAGDSEAARAYQQREERAIDTPRSPRRRRRRRSGAKRSRPAGQQQP